MILDLLELLGSIGIEVLRPGEDRAGGYFVEANVGQCLEELVPIDEPCSLLLDKGGAPGWCDALMDCQVFFGQCLFVFQAAFVKSRKSRSTSFGARYPRAE